MLRFVFEPVRKSFSDASRPARERTVVEYPTMCAETALRVAAEEEVLAVDPALDVVCEDRLPVGGEDLPAVDLELGDPLDRVVLPVFQARRGPRLPVGRADDERREQCHRHHGDTSDLLVHERPSSENCETEFARCESRRRPASRMKLATTLEPP